MLSFAWPGVGHAVLLFFDRAWSPTTWYVNVQDPYAPVPGGFDTMDHDLDVLVALDGTSVRWKDEDELLEDVRLGNYTQDEAATFRAEGERGVRRILEREPPLDRDWTTWRPDASWPPPTLPAGGPARAPRGVTPAPRDGAAAFALLPPAAVSRKTLPVTPIDPSRVRSSFPSLSLEMDGRPVVFVDAPGGSQVPGSVVDAMAAYLRTSNANTHGAFPTSQETDRVIDEAHRAGADLLGADPERIVVFGPNATTLMFSISRSVARTLRPGDEVAA